jgi:hypothetical protein
MRAFSCSRWGSLPPIRPSTCHRRRRAPTGIAARRAVMLGPHPSPFPSGLGKGHAPQSHSTRLGGSASSLRTYLEIATEGSRVNPLDGPEQGADQVHCRSRDPSGKNLLPQFAATRGGMTTRAGFVTRFRSATISMSVAAIGRLWRFCPGGAHEFLSLRLLRRPSSRLHL